MTGGAESVAIIIPAYQAAAYLDQTLASVAAQTLPPAEVVVSDDCSTDGTVAVAERWKAFLPLTVITAGENAGQAAARNAALAASSSAMVALLDADDVLLPDHLETLVELHRRTGGVVMADALRWVPNAALADRSWVQLLPVPAPDKQLQAICKENFTFICCLFDRALLDGVGEFRTQFRGTEDWDLWIRLIRSGARIAAADHPTVLYRLTQASTSAQDRMIDAKIAVLARARLEATSQDERRAIQQGLRRLRAERHLFTSYELARSGDRWRSRWHGLAAAPGRKSVAARGLAMALAPRLFGAMRTQRRGVPQSRLNG